MTRDLTRFEAGCDKPRHAALNDPPTSVNLNDRFRLAAAASPTGSAPTGPNTVANPGFETGTQGDAEVHFTFAEIDAWSNNGTKDDLVAARHDDPHGGDYRGMLVSALRIPWQLTNHVIAGGERMLLDFWHTGKNNWIAGDNFSAEIFYLDAGGTTVSLGSTVITATPASWQRTVHLFPPITDPAATGRALGIRFFSNAASQHFASIDDVWLSTGAETPGPVALNWSDAGVWTDPATGATKTLLRADAFPGCVLGFPVTPFSWTAANGMKRPTDLEFMLNQLDLTGSSAGGAKQTGTINGNDLLFTVDLAGSPPRITIDAAAPDFGFIIDNDLLLCDDLSISGDGSCRVTFSGDLRDYDQPRSLAKDGGSAVTFAGTLAHGGNTDLTGGSLVLAGGSVISRSPRVTTAAGTTLGGTGRIAGALLAAGTIAPGHPTGTLSAGSATLTGKLAVEIDGTAADRLEVDGMLDVRATILHISTPGGGATQAAYVIASYGSLSGPFAAVSGLPAGYRVNYQHGSTGKQIAVVVATPYDTWTDASGLAGAEAVFEADPNRDGLANGLAFLLGATSAMQDALPLMPTCRRDGTRFIFAFRRANAASSLSAVVEYGTTLTGWTVATDGSAGVTVEQTDNGHGPGIDRIEVGLPASLAQQGRLFARLRVSAP